MTYTDLFDLVLGNLGVLVVLSLIVVGFVREWIVPGASAARNQERMLKLDGQLDSVINLVGKVITNQEMADEREKVRHERDRERGG